MMMITCSSSLSPPSLPPLPKIKHLTRISNRPTSSFLNYQTPADSHRLVLPQRISLTVKKQNKKMGTVCFASAAFNTETLQWVSAISSAKPGGLDATSGCGSVVDVDEVFRPNYILFMFLNYLVSLNWVLMLVKGTAIHKSFLVPLFALQAPLSIISWMKGEYGMWSAFLAVLVRLFYFIPGELDLPFWTLFLVIVAPYRAMDLRGGQPGAMISFAIAVFLAFQHFSRAGSLQRAFDQGSIVATVAVTCIAVVSCLFLF